MVYRATQFKAAPNAETVGQVMQAWIQAIHSDDVLPILARHGIADIEAEAWYPWQPFLDAQKEISELQGGGPMLVSLGKAAADTVVLPPDLDHPSKLLALMNTVHHLNFRSIPEAEGYIVEEVNDNTYHLTVNNPIPNDIIFGYMWSMMARLTPKGQEFVVEPHENYPDETHGATFRIAWGNKEDL